MTIRTPAALVLAFLLIAQCAPGSALAENQMGYRLLTAQEASELPRNNGGLGLSVERWQQIISGGMTFDIIRVTQVRPGSTGAQAGFKPGDNIIAVNDRVFPTLTAFAAYIGAMSPGSQVTVDYIPTGGGPQQAQRVAAVIDAAGRNAQSPGGQQPGGQQSTASGSTGMSTGTKVAIGAGAVALLGCYELGCFSHRHNPTPTNAGRQPSQQQPYQQQNSQQSYQQPNALPQRQ